MKKLINLFVLLFFVATVFAQAPQKFSYQGVIRDAAGNLVRNAPVGVRVSLLKNSTEGVAVYCETHRQTTNANGLLTLTIGDGTVVGGDMATIDWADGPYFLKTETDITGGSNYTLIGAQQLLSVPYALYAGSTTNAFSGDYNDLSNKPEIPQVPTEVSAFTNDAGYISNKECDNLSYCQLVSQLTKLQNTVDSLKEKVQEGGSGQGDISNNDGKPCKGVAAVMDVDSNIYNTVQIGEQCWMKENLKTTKYADGTSISKGSTTSTTIAYWYFPNNDFSNKDTYGLLYNWKAVMRNSPSTVANPSGVQGVCPTGWHVPSDAEWTQLKNYLSNQVEYVCNMTEEKIGKALASTSGWENSSTTCAVGNLQIANNTTGFSAVPAGGYNSYYGKYEYFGNMTRIWSATEYNSVGANGLYLNYDDASMGLGGAGGKCDGYSVRCLRDEQAEN
ncbi:MAG: fibrobacter succinogenes major paralogous domain-containing protein [Bacteroidales bacterium]|nr:fibrobacter succinogenes major paralogous domain-containing protein [Bacteroidales bacterium]